MNFENYIELVEKTINNLISKYGVFYLKNDLLGESFICFKNCKEKFKGEKEKFYFYLKKSLERHLKKIIFKELEIRNKSVEIEEETFDKIEVKTEYKDIEEILKKSSLDEIERKICLMRTEGKSFLKISKEINLPYHRVLKIRDKIRMKLSEFGFYNDKFTTRYELWKGWYEKNKENYKEYQKSYRKKNKDKINKCQKRWREKNKERFKKYMREYMKEYRRKNKDKIKKYNEKWKKNNPYYYMGYMRWKRFLNSALSYLSGDKGISRESL